MGRTLRLSIDFVALSEPYHARARELLTRHVWKRDWSDHLAQEYFAWRYINRPDGETLLALDRGRCIGIVDSFFRPYWIGGCRQKVRETCDWFCLPAYRPLGVGLHLLRRIMDNPEPTIAIGGTSIRKSCCQSFGGRAFPASTILFFRSPPRRPPRSSPEVLGRALLGQPV